MSEVKKVIRVFLGSPSDLGEERKQARMVVDDVNSLIGDIFSCRIELIGWEDTVSVFGRPQATINRELERCELFIGLMWKRWGTPPSKVGPYTSGFEEEFRSCIERRNSTGIPGISLLFKEVGSELLTDPGEELQKVLSFKRELIDGKYVLFEEFSNLSEFERKFRRCLTNHVKAAHAQDEGERSIANQVSLGESSEKADVLSKGMTPLSTEGARFIVDLVSRTEVASGQKPVSSTDVARFRLLTTILRQHGNDEIFLGVHDANLIFQNRSTLNLGQTEKGGLVSAGLARINNENIPLWHWLAPILSQLAVRTVFGIEVERVGALKAMQLISHELTDEGPFSRSVFVDSWFHDDLSPELKVAALNYLSECGELRDLPIIKKEMERNNNQTVAAAIDSFVQISLRSGKNEGLTAIYELQPASVSNEVLHIIFCEPKKLANATLREGLNHKSPDVRKKVTEILIARGELEDQVAEELLSDNDRGIRNLALSSLVSGGRVFSDDEAKKILTENRQGLMMTAISGDDRYWLDFQRAQLRGLDRASLTKISNEESIFSVDAKLALIENNFKNLVPELRRLVDDQFECEFARKLSEMERRHGVVSDVVSKTRSLGPFLRKKFTRQALDLLCKKGDAFDLLLVRKSLASGFVECSSEDINFLRKHGEWKDIQLLVESTERIGAYLLLTIWKDSRVSLASRAIIAIGSRRLRELLEISMPAPLLGHVIARAPESSFATLNDAALMRLLLNESESVRKVAALKCGLSLSKSRVQSLLNSYSSGDQYRYYNVIYWLDFATSIGRKSVRTSIAKVIKQNWILADS